MAEVKKTEQELFDELAALCQSPGYAHAIAAFCFRDNVVSYGDELKGEDYAKLFSPNRLIRTEISTLIGLMARAPIDYTLPSQEKIAEYLTKTEYLLNAIHHAMIEPFVADFKAAIADGQKQNPFTSAEAMREPIFYGAESAYSFQYRDLAPSKYGRDEVWMKQNKGFTIADAATTVRVVNSVQEQKLLSTIKGLREKPPAEWSVIDGFSFSAADIAAQSKQPTELVEKILSAFSFPDDNNPTFKSLHDFNATNAFPLLKKADGQYVLFQYVSLTEAISETPFYWMISDKGYADEASTHRGQFTEEFVAARLERVFGKENVFRNIDIWESKGKKIGEIDTLVLFADRAIVVQEKSKKLTLAARKGNDLQLQEDFKGAVQDAYDQAWNCSEQLEMGTAKFTDAAGKEIKIPESIKGIYPICVVADHYPALSFQARQFLKHKTTDTIKVPLICDVFTVDSTTEMLESPIRLVNYLDVRASGGENIMLSHESVALAYHLKRNAWPDEFDIIQIGDDITADLDIAMAVRRDGIDGARTPPGILTELGGLTVGRIIQQIEKRSDSASFEFGLQLLRSDGESAHTLSKLIDKIVGLAASDGKGHNASVGFSKAGVGITVYCSAEPDSEAAAKLKSLCVWRKCAQKAGKWFGLAVRPGTGELRFGLVLESPWQANAEMDKVVANMPKGLTPKALLDRGISRPGKKVGRYQRCPCGSMLKYIKCCLRRRK